MRPLLVLLLACGAEPVPGPAPLPAYTGQARCDCRDLGFTRMRPRFTDQRCDAFWGCGLEGDGQACHQVCGWVDVE